MELYGNNWKLLLKHMVCNSHFRPCSVRNKYKAAIVGDKDAKKTVASIRNRMNNIGRKVR